MFVIFSEELGSHAKREESGYFIFYPQTSPIQVSMPTAITMSQSLGTKQKLMTLKIIS